MRLDPRLELLAKIDIDLTPAMLAAQLGNNEDVVGRLRAVAMLRDKKDHDSVAQLKAVLNHDPFYGLRIEAATALASIHSEESLDAILSSMAQTDPRVRNAEAAGLAAFYSATAFAAEAKALVAEKNPDIQAQHIKGVANYANPEAHDLLLPLLQSHSYRNSLADSAIAGMRAQDDTVYLAPLQQILEQRRDDFMTRGFTTALDTLGYLARHEEKKDAVLQFLSGFVNDKNPMIRASAIKALGTLQDPRAVPLLQTFASAGKTTPEQPVAQAALDAIRAARPAGDNLIELRDTVLDLQKENRQMRQDLDDLRKKLDLRPAPPSAKAKSSSATKP